MARMTLMVALVKAAAPPPLALLTNDLAKLMRVCWSCPRTDKPQMNEVITL